LSEYEFDPGTYGQDFEEGKESAGFVNEPLPKGRYPLRVDKIVGKRPSKKGVPSASLLLRVMEGASAKRTALITLYLDAGPTFRKDGEEFNRTTEQKSTARRGVTGRMKGLLTAMALPHDNPVAASPENPTEYLCEKFGIDNMPGQEFMAEITVQGNFNNMLNFHPLTHEKYGIDKWREQEAARSGDASGAASL